MPAATVANGIIHRHRVLDHSIIVNGYSSLLPLDSRLEVQTFVEVVEQEVKQRVAFHLLHTDYLGGIYGVDPNRLPASHGVLPDNRVHGVDRRAARQVRLDGGQVLAGARVDGLQSVEKLLHDG